MELFHCQKLYFTQSFDVSITKTQPGLDRYASLTHGLTERKSQWCDYTF